MGDGDELGGIGRHVATIDAQSGLYNYGCGVELDTVTALYLTGLALTTEALGRLHAAGHPDLRISHGFVVQHLVEGPVRIGDLAVRMGVTQQAASKAVAELEALGYLERTSDPGDARVRRVGLSARGAAAVSTTRAVRADIERELAAALGAGRVEEARRTALDALEWAGGAEAVRGRRVRPPR
jgi:DNA-binding MarR family transcriptional regulator